MIGCAVCRMLSEDMESPDSMELTSQERARIWARLVPSLPATHKARFWSFLGTWIFRPVPATALAVLVVALAGLILTQKNNRQETFTTTPRSTGQITALPFQRPGVPGDSAVFWRGRKTMTSYEAKLQSALVPYEKGDYATAAKQLEQVEKSHPTKFGAKFYDGVSLLLLGDARGAMQELEAAKGVANAQEIHQAIWYLAIAEQRAGQNDSAFSELQQLCKAEGPYAAKACDAVKRVSPSASPSPG
jgi:tetratricopeptide (TPR) repeat protein